MSFEISLDGKAESIEILKQDGNTIEVLVGDRKYHLDIVEVEEGIYSILLDGKSYNVEVSPVERKKYTAHTLYNNFDVEILDAESRYMNSRKGDIDEEQSFISTPMPGKVVKILVEPGQEVKAGDTLVVVSAMKMESEYKVSKDRTVKDVLVKEGDSIDGHQPLITLE